jgi:TetR/AcrR family transcriptional repressor of nem operon
MPTPARGKILEAAVTAIRHRGYAGTTVDEICRAAEVSKGAFFHHFRSKDDLAAAAAAHFSDCADALLFAAPALQVADPRERVLGYLQLRRAILRGGPGDFGCYLGTIVQEAHESHPDLAHLCGRRIFDHAARIEAMLAEAKALYAPEANWTPRTLALFSQAALQGAFVLAKAGGGAEMATQCVDHLIDYVERALGVERSPHREKEAA